MIRAGQVPRNGWPQERHRRNNVVPAMAPWLNLPALAGSLVTAIALGIHLGESSVGLINPIHFQGPAVHPRDRGAAIDPATLPTSRGPAYADLYGWDEGRTAVLADCGHCEALGARDRYAYSAVVPYFGGRSERPAPAAEPAPVAPQETVVTPSPEYIAREAQVARYARYPVAEARANVPDYAANDVYLTDEEAAPASGE